VAKYENTRHVGKNAIIELATIERQSVTSQKQARDIYYWTTRLFDFALYNYTGWSQQEFSGYNLVY